MRTPNPDHPIRNALKHLALGVAAVAAFFTSGPSANATPVTTGLALWLDASDATTMTIDGSGVAEWRDKNGSAAKMTRQAGAPTVVATGIGGIPTVHFDTSSRMNDGVNHGTPVTIFYVSRQTGGANNRVLGASSNNWLLGYWGGNRGSAYFDGDVFLGGNGAPDTAPHLYTTTIGGGGQNSTVWAEGVQIASNQNGTAGPNNLQLNGYEGGNELSDCDISEVLVYHRILDANELLAVGGYLTAKYSLTTSYPTGLTVALTSPANGSDYLVGATIPATASVVSGTAPYSVEFFLDSGSGFVSQGTDSGSPYTVNLTGLAIGTYSIKASVTDSTPVTPATDESPTHTFTVSNAGPGNLAAVSSNQLVNLSWNQVLGATGYKVFRSSPDNSSYSEIATGITGLTYQDTGLTNGTPYFYVVRATVGATVSDPSNEASSTPLAVDDSKATVVASAPFVWADGVATSTITVTLKDGGNAPAPGLTVTLASSRPSDDTVSAASGPSDANGVVTFTVQSSVVGTSEYTATVTGIPLTLTDTATVGFADPATPFGINVNMDTTVQTGLEGPVGGLGAVWNTTGASASNLSLASGVASTVGFTSSGTGGWIPFESDIEPTLRLLKRGYVNFGANGTTQQLVITGLDPAKTYDLTIASAILISSNQASRGEWSTTNTTSTVGNQAVDNTLDENGSTWVRGNNYVLFEDVVPDGSGNITANGFAITGDPYDIRLPLNGFQLVETPPAPPAFRWAGADGGNWTDVANWNNTVPGALDIAILSDSAGAGQTLTLDADAAVAGLTFNNLVANQVIASPTGKTLTLQSGNFVTVNDGSHTISANVDITSGTKLGSGTVNLSGTVAAHHAGGGNIALFVSDGVLGISGTTTVDSAKRVIVNGGGTLEVTGVLNTAGPLFPVGTNAFGDSAATATVILKGSGQWNQTHTTGGDVAIGISGNNNGKLIIQDTAQLNTAFMVLGFFGPGTGTVQQDGGTVTLVTTPAYYTALARPALWIGVTGPGDYHLNGGTLNCGTIGGTGKLYLNGGRLVANMDDLIIVDPGGALSAAVGQTSFMQGLNQVVVQSGAVIDTAGNIITIAQNLEHDTDGPAIDGGLTKQGLGTLKLLGTNTYTGATKVQGGTLACATAASLAPTALEIDAAAKVDLTYTGNRNIPSLKIGVDVKGPGVYGSSSSPAPPANQDDVHFAGEGTVTVGGSSGFTTWASANGATGQTAQEDHDNDGVKNGIEYFMGETGSSFTAMPGLDATNTITWPASAAYVGTYEVQTSPDLATWTNVDPRPPIVSGTLSYTLPPGAPGGTSFVRLLVTPTP